MAKFRKKPIVVEAEQYRVNGEVIPGVCTYSGCKRLAHVHTRNGVTDLTDGDWVIKDMGGIYYPCSDSEFRATYELVDGERTISLPTKEKRV